MTVTASFSMALLAGTTMLQEPLIKGNECDSSRINAECASHLTGEGNPLTPENSSGPLERLGIALSEIEEDHLAVRRDALGMCQRILYANEEALMSWRRYVLVDRTRAVGIDTIFDHRYSNPRTFNWTVPDANDVEEAITACGARHNLSPGTVRTRLSSVNIAGLDYRPRGTDPAVYAEANDFQAPYPGTCFCEIEPQPADNGDHWGLGCLTANLDEIELEVSVDHETSSELCREAQIAVLLSSSSSILDLYQHIEQISRQRQTASTADRLRRSRIRAWSSINDAQGRLEESLEAARRDARLQEYADYARLAGTIARRLPGAIDQLQSWMTSGEQSERTEPGGGAVDGRATPRPRVPEGLSPIEEWELPGAIYEMLPEEHHDSIPYWEPRYYRTDSNPDGLEVEQLASDLWAVTSRLENSTVRDFFDGQIGSATLEDAATRYVSYHQAFADLLSQNEAYTANSTVMEYISDSVALEADYSSVLIHSLKYTQSGSTGIQHQFRSSFIYFASIAISVRMDNPGEYVDAINATSLI